MTRTARFSAHQLQTYNRAQIALIASVEGDYADDPALADIEQDYAEEMSSLGTDHLGIAIEAQRAVRDAESALADARIDFSAAVRAALEAGVPAVVLADDLGLSRARIYQVRDGQR